jgi:hypothetical protein
VTKDANTIAILERTRTLERDHLLRVLPREAAHNRQHRLARKHGIEALAQRDGAGTPPRAAGVSKLSLRCAKSEERRQMRERRRQAVMVRPITDPPPVIDGTAKQREQALRGSRLLT